MNYLHSTLLCVAVFLPYAALSPYLAVLTRSLGFSPSVTGLLLGAAECAAIGAPLFVCALADKYRNYKSTLLTSLAVTIICAASLILLKNPIAAALLIPLLSGGYRATVPLSDAAITVNIGRDGNYGKVRAMGSLSFVLMVLTLQLTPVMRPNTATHIAFWALLTSLAEAAVILLLPISFLKPTLKAPTAAAAPANPVFGRDSRKERTIWTPFFVIGLLIIFLNRLAFSPIQAYISLYTVEYLNWDAVGLMSAIAATSELPFIFLSHHLLSRHKPLKLISLTTAVVALRLFLLAFFPGKATLVLTQMLHSFTFGVFHPAAVAFIVTNVPPEKRALGMSVYLSLGTGLPTLLGSTTGGLIIEQFGYRALYSSFITFALLALAASLPANRLQK